MTLTPADRNRILAAFRERIGNAALPASITVDDLCMNLLLAIPALVETCEALEGHCAACHEIEAQEEEEDTNARIAEVRRLVENNITLKDRIAELERASLSLTAQLEADPCP